MNYGKETENGWLTRHRSFFPVILQALRQTPVIGTFLSLPYIRQVSPSAHLCARLRLVMADWGITGGR